MTPHLLASLIVAERRQELEEAAARRRLARLARRARRARLGSEEPSR
jgi:hypothetical protein